MKKRTQISQAEEKPSKSAKKRESAALQKLGEELLKLTPDKRAQMSLTPDLMEALDLHDTIKDKEGARRQRQYIGKLMRTQDYEKISKELEHLREAKSKEIANFHKIEQWRDKLLSTPEEGLTALLKKLVESCTNGESFSLDKLLDMTLRAKKEKNTPAGLAASRALFRELARIMNEGKNN